MITQPKIVEISRDPFARETLVRRLARLTYHAPGDGCAWCGSTRRNQDRLFQYGVERDDRPGRVAWDEHRFCGIECRRAYYDQ